MPIPIKAPTSNPVGAGLTVGVGIDVRVGAVVEGKGIDVRVEGVGDGVTKPSVVCVCVCACVCVCVCVCVCAFMSKMKLACVTTRVTYLLVLLGPVPVLVSYL